MVHRLNCYYNIEIAARSQKVSNFNLEFLYNSGNIYFWLVQYYIGDSFDLQGCEIQLVSA